MKVRVDEAKCMGHARCIAFAPEVFAWRDEDDQAYVPEGTDLAGHEEAVRRAAMNCPERAILTED